MSLRLTEAEYFALQSKNRISRIIQSASVKEWIPQVQDEKALLEDAIQGHLFSWIRHLDNQFLFPGLDVIYAIPNGSKRSKFQGALLKATGMESGIPDVHIPVSRKPFYSLYIELKTFTAYQKTNHSLSENQQIWIEKLRKQGHRVEVIWSLTEAIQTIRDYLGKRIL
jgi:hypothetical protein